MNKHAQGKCFHCGADDGLHQYETMKCPRFGIEAPVGRDQEWDEKTFVNADYQRLCDVAPVMLEALKKIAKSNMDEDGCFYTNRTNILIANEVISQARLEQ